MITPQQAEKRLDSIGSSDSPIIAGYSSFMTSRELYHIKRREITPTEPGERADIGNIIESAIADIFTYKTGVETILTPYTVYHPQYPFISCHLDRKLPTGYILEIKNSSESKDWGREEDGAEGVPIKHNIQVQHQMACTDTKQAVIAVLLWGNTLKVYEIPRDDELIEMIINLDLEFWDCVKNGTPPEISFDHGTTIDLLKKIYPGTNGEIIDLPEEMVYWHSLRVEASETYKVYKKKADGAKAHIMNVMEQNAVGLLPDGTGYNRKADKNGKITLRYSKKP